MGKKIAKIYIEGTIEKKNANYNQEWLLKTIKSITDSKKYAAILVYINTVSIELICYRNILSSSKSMIIKGFF